MTAAPLFIQSIGLASPLGLTADSSYAAHRAKMDRFQTLPYRDDAGGALTGSCLESLGEPRAAKDRWLPLLCHAVRDALRGLPADRDAVFILALPAGATLDDARALWEEHGVPESQRRLCSGGPFAGHQAISTARALLTEGRAPAVLVAGADSLINARALLPWSQDRRLLTEENSDGILPGEAAAALMFHRRRGPLGSIVGMGVAQEPSLVTNDIPLKAQGLVTAARAALGEAGLAMHDLDVRLSDASGEAFHFKEQTLLVLRMLRRNKDSFPLWRSASSLGYCGAATALCDLVMALSAAKMSRFPGRRAIACAGDDQGRRGALILDLQASR